MSTLPADQCPNRSTHGSPFRYCPYCSWTEPVAVVVQQPGVGRIVHYQQWNSPEPLAAIITAVLDDDRVNLAVYQKSGMSDPRPSAPYSETPEDGHWNWPPRT